MTFVFLAGCCTGLAQIALRVTGTALAEAPCDAPQAQPPAQPFAPAPKQMTLASFPPARKYAQMIEPGQQSYRFRGLDKMVFSFTEFTRPVTVLPALYSAGFEQIFETDPKYGHDAGAFGDKFGAAMLRRTSVRFFADGVFATAFHQDPRYYRIGEGSIVHRGLLSARQAVVRRGDDGANQVNFSGIAGRAAAAVLTVTYYPEPSVNGRVVTSTFLTSIASDAGGDLLLEFIPSLVRRFPVMRKLHLE